MILLKLSLFCISFNDNEKHVDNVPVCGVIVSKNIVNILFKNITTIFKV